MLGAWMRSKECEEDLGQCETKENEPKDRMPSRRATQACRVALNFNQYENDPTDRHHCRREHAGDVELKEFKEPALRSNLLT
jgi:hypothetical protein